MKRELKLKHDTMKTKLLALLIGLPFLALAQSETATKSDNAKHATKKVRLAKHLTKHTTKSIDKNIVTTLINDIKKEKSQLGFDLHKSYHLSINDHASTLFNGINGSKKGPIQLNVKPLNSNARFNNK